VAEIASLSFRLICSPPYA